MNDTIRELHAVIGRGECVQFKWPHGTDEKWVNYEGHLIPIGHPDYAWRIKPKTRELTGIAYPEPLRVAPEPGTKVWLASPTTHDLVNWHIWGGDSVDRVWLSRGLLQVTEEGARNQARAFIAASGGSLE